MIEEQTKKAKENAFGGLFNGGGIMALLAALISFFKDGFAGLFGGLGGNKAERTAATSERSFNVPGDRALRSAAPIAPAFPQISYEAKTPIQKQGQDRVMSVLADAANAANISPKLMVGVWSKETSFGRSKLTSETGCQGQWQFSRNAMVEEISNNGATIAGRLRNQGRPEEARFVEEMHKQTRGMTADQIKNYAASNKNAVDFARNNEFISTYAAAFHLRANANRLGLNPNAPSNFGMIYAGYNIGTGHAKTILNGGQATGWEVDANAGIAGKGNQRVAYDTAIANGIRAGSFFVAKAEADTNAILARQSGTAPTQVASVAPDSNVRFIAAKRTGNSLDNTPSLKDQTAVFSSKPADLKVAEVTTVAPTDVPAVNDAPVTRNKPLFAPALSLG